MKLIAIIETDNTDKKTDVIGISDSKESADRMVDEYFGLSKETTNLVVRDYECGDEMGMPIRNCKIEGYYDLDDNWYSHNVLYMEYKLNEV